MLVLSRRVGEKLLIGDDIVVTIIDTRGDGVRIGIEAPRSTRVNRAEVVEAVTASNIAAVAAGEGAEDVLRQLIHPGGAPGARGAATQDTAAQDTAAQDGDAAS